MHHKPHRVVGLGGTFDHFHAGHEKLLLFASELGDRLIIGITVQNLTQTKNYPKTIQDFELRQRQVAQFCRRHHIKAETFPLKDVYGPTLEGSEIKALAVTQETTRGADQINQTRTHLGLRPLPVYICDYFIAQNDQPLHAEAIRAGQLNRQGQEYSRVFTNDLQLNKTQREFFTQPQGKIVTAPTQNAPLTCVVGDVCLENFLKHHWPFTLGIYDGRQQRAEYVPAEIAELTPNWVLKNPPGHISPILIKGLHKALTLATKHPNYLKIEGEEDLAAVALFLLLPLDSLVYYGQPNQGMVEVVITEEFKEKIFEVVTA